jgi:hypothetical protein
MQDTAIRALLTELYEAGQQNDAQEQERSKKMLNLEPDTAQLLHILICSIDTPPDKSRGILPSSSPLARPRLPRASRGGLSRSV